MIGAAVPFYYELSWHLTPDRIHYELSARHPIHGRSVLATWSGLRPKGLVTPQWIANTFYTAALDLIEAADLI